MLIELEKDLLRYILGHASVAHKRSRRTKNGAMVQRKGFVEAERLRACLNRVWHRVRQGSRAFAHNRRSQLQNTAQPPFVTENWHSSRAPAQGRFGKYDLKSYLVPHFKL